MTLVPYRLPPLVSVARHWASLVCSKKAANHPKLLLAWLYGEIADIYVRR